MWTSPLPASKKTAQRGVASASRDAQRGVTLIELMIAVSITAVITVGLLFALRTSIVAYEKTSDRLQSNREQLSRNQILSRELSGAMPVMSTCGNANVPYFFGAASTLRMISSYSIAEGFRGYPQILDFETRRSPSGALQLVVTEYPYTGPSSTTALCGDSATSLSGTPSEPFVLADDLLSCAFSYRGTANPLAAKQDVNWASDWKTVNSLPLAIKVEMKPRSAPCGGLPSVNVTVPLRVDRDIFRSYTD
jgi:prepilin-type N-terminal cleavage/methylation domain-containing protein